MKIIFATANKGKLREAQDILGSDVEIISPAGMGITEDIPETGETLEENSLQKAMYIYKKTGMDCFADDTGLEVDALGGAPGVHSARYCSQGHDFDGNIRKLLHEMEGVPFEKRTARFRCVVTLILDGEKYTFDGEMKGRISLERAGCKGFGYDPVFIADDFPEQTIATVGEEMKNAISHRGKSLRKMDEFLKKRKAG